LGFKSNEFLFSIVREIKLKNTRSRCYIDPCKRLVGKRNSKTWPFQA